MRFLGSILMVFSSSGINYFDDENIFSFSLMFSLVWIYAFLVGWKNASNAKKFIKKDLKKFWILNCLH